MVLGIRKEQNFSLDYYWGQYIKSVKIGMLVIEVCSCSKSKYQGIRHGLTRKVEKG
ncbi:hypothetical protein [Orenia metallireducens]|jgi:hypothetical protein|uniref:hypothetical protein n=1 Tax=Orenia metallireducens TaxID=1413210 RepID=UPI00159EFE6D|nr:hypothetical protein [Orenia metallireducens]